MSFHILWQESQDKMAIVGQDVQLLPDHLLNQYSHILLKLQLFVVMCGIWIPKKLGYNVRDIMKGLDDAGRALFDDVLYSYTATLFNEDVLCPTFNNHQLQRTLPTLTQKFNCSRYKSEAIQRPGFSHLLTNHDLSNAVQSAGVSSYFHFTWTLTHSQA